MPLSKSLIQSGPPLVSAKIPKGCPAPRRGQKAQQARLRSARLVSCWSRPWPCTKQNRLAAGWELSSAGAVLTQELAPTPACHDSDEPTVHQTEGPFFKPKSPERSDLRE